MHINGTKINDSYSIICKVLLSTSMIIVFNIQITVILLEIYRFIINGMATPSQYPTCHLKKCCNSSILKIEMHSKIKVLGSLNTYVK
jgi:hypothetical protein